MGYVRDLVIGAIGSLVAAEAWSHADFLARRIIEKAVARLPGPSQELRREEWIAHLEETPGATRKLLHAMGCFAGASAMASLAQSAGRKRRNSLFTYWKEPLFRTFLKEG